MKRGLILLLFIFLCTSLVCANNVTLFNPEEVAFTDTNDINFICNASALTQISNISLYVGNGTNFDLNYTLNVEDVQAQLDIIVENFKNGFYIWNCRVTLENTSVMIAENNWTFNVEIPEENGMPILLEDIPNQTLNKNEKKYLNLSKYFVDPDEDELEFWASSNSFLDFEFINGGVNLTPQEGWTGQTSVIFYVTDGSHNVSSNEVFFVVKDTSSINLSQLNLFNQKEDMKIVGLLPVEKSFVFEDTVQFFINVSGRDSLRYEWYVDDVLVEETNMAYYNFSGIDLGFYEIKVEVYDNDNDSISYVWNVKKEVYELPQSGQSEEENVVEENVVENEEPEGSMVIDLGDDFVILIIGLVVGIVVFILVVGIVFKLIRKKVENSEKKSVEKLKKIEEMSIEKPVNSSEDVSTEKPVNPSEDVSTEKPANPSEDVSTEKPANPSENDKKLENFIQKMREKGHNDEEIRTKLLEAGWKKEQIDTIIK